MYNVIIRKQQFALKLILEKKINTLPLRFSGLLFHKKEL